MVENDPAAGTVTATDSDTQDNIEKYVITGGADMARFSIAKQGQDGILTFNDAPNFEANGSVAGDNAYKVEVTVTSGTGDREATAVQNITVNVTDVAEAPDKPASPTLAVVDFESLRATWTAPDNRGPSQILYRLQYRLSGDSDWTDGPTGVAGLTRIIDGLDPGMEYEVRVQAENEEGASEWSEASATAVATHHNRPPAFASTVANYEVQENTTAVTTVTATDPDASQVQADATITYALEGDDGGRFRIASNGVVTFESGKDFEDPDDTNTDGVYEVTVRATSGAGVREMSATRSFTVTLTNAGGEAPGPPGKPTLDMATVESLRATWSAPATNPGPPVTGYDLQYQRTDTTTPNVWTPGPQNVSGSPATITGLETDADGVAYRVQVLARNLDGAGDWSPSSDPLTTVANGPPANWHRPWPAARA